MGSRMESAMRSDLFDKMQRLPFSYYDKNNTGEMMTKMVSDLFDISEVAHHGPENLFLAFLKLIGSFVLLMMVHVPLTLILFAVVIIMCIFSVFQNKRMKKAFSDNNKKIANINAQLQDSLAGIRVVKSFANETVEKEKFQKANVSFLSSKKTFLPCIWKIPIRQLIFPRDFIYRYFGIRRYLYCTRHIECT